MSSQASLSPHGLSTLHHISLCLNVCVSMTIGCMCSSGDTQLVSPQLYPLSHTSDPPLTAQCVRPPFLQYMCVTWYSPLLLLGAPLTPVWGTGGSCLQVFRVTTQQPLTSFAWKCYPLAATVIGLLPKDVLADPTTFNFGQVS